MKVVVGLGNVGKDYAQTRHNAGWVFLDVWADMLSAEWQMEKKLKSEIAEVGIDDEILLLVKPTTFMNNSGEAIQALVKKYELIPADFLVVYDDVDLPIGSYKISVGKGDGGHNGVKSIISHFKSKDFVRLRLGVAPVGFFGRMIPKTGSNRKKFVLSRLSKKDQQKLTQLAKELFPALQVWVIAGAQKMMNQFNKKPKK